MFVCGRKARSSFTSCIPAILGGSAKALLTAAPCGSISERDASKLQARRHSHDAYNRGKRRHAMEIPDFARDADWDIAQARLAEAGLSDGLPLVLPTRERVES